MKPAEDGLSNKFIDTKLIVDYLLQNSPSAKVRFIEFVPKVKYALYLLLKLRFFSLNFSYFYVS